MQCLKKIDVAGLSLKKTTHVWLPHAKTFITMACDSKSHPITWCVISGKLNTDVFTSNFYEWKLNLTGSYK